MHSRSLSDVVSRHGIILHDVAVSQADDIIDILADIVMVWIAEAEEFGDYTDELLEAEIAEDIREEIPGHTVTVKVDVDAGEAEVRVDGPRHSAHVSLSFDDWNEV